MDDDKCVKIIEHQQGKKGVSIDLRHLLHYQLTNVISLKQVEMSWLLENVYQI